MFPVLRDMAKQGGGLPDADLAVADTLVFDYVQTSQEKELRLSLRLSLGLSSCGFKPEAK